ncbi:hypothetical protein IQ07DRAFT_163317 [Pyrenochaeta sp. DS3sAY3a]|nr:hypothetical protein IQ07DRAFT_163317 [Pyrenochaeta sp. DS3sAY3a]
MSLTHSMSPRPTPRRRADGPALARLPRQLLLTLCLRPPAAALPAQRDRSAQSPNEAPLARKRRIGEQRWPMRLAGTASARSPLVETVGLGCKQLAQACVLVSESRPAFPALANRLKSAQSRSA